MINPSLLDNAKAFYLNEGTVTISDKEYDKLFTESGLSKNELFDLIGLERNKTHKFSRDFRELPKLTIHSYDELPEIDPDNEYLNFKYDGSSLTAFYKDGIQQGIVSASGILQTKKLTNHFPKRVDSRITRIYSEGVVDINKYGDTARSFANGMVNSVNHQSKVDEDFKIICFDIECTDVKDKWELMEYLSMYQTDDRFWVAEAFNKVSDYPDMVSPVQINIEGLGISVYVDGVVKYTMDQSDDKIYKLYANTAPESEVVKINMIYQPQSDQIAPKLNITPVKIDGTNVANIASSVNNIFNKGLGRGAKITVIKAGQTIPKEREVLERSDDFQDLVCVCGYILTKNDGVGNNFKCKNTECDRRYSNLRKELDGKSKSDVVDSLFLYLKLPSFKMSRVPIHLNKFNAINQPSYNDFIIYLRSHMTLTNSQDKVLDLNAKALWEVYQDL